jgi:CubicO group peptidase (beta-lactamase class C family)
MRLRMRIVLVTLAFRIILNPAAFAQDVSAQKVDQVFSDYEKPGSPGCSLGVIRGGDFVYRFGESRTGSSSFAALRFLHGFSVEAVHSRIGGTRR